MYQFINRIENIWNKLLGIKPIEFRRLTLSYTQNHLTDLSFLDEGKKWLPESQMPRLASYELADALYDGDYEHLILNELVKRVGQSKVYASDNTPIIPVVKTNTYKSVVDAFQWLTLGNAPKRESTNQNALDDIIYSNDFDTSELIAYISDLVVESNVPLTFI
jgi:hypothetical protein